jgi:TolB-like protein/Tfp pilus assembly protein PilF
MSFVTELKRRNVFKVGIAYAIVAWLLIQITDTVAPALHLPEWTLTLIVYLLIIGFILALFLAWAYEITPEGIKPTTEVAPGDSITQRTGQKLNYIVTVLLVLVVAFVVIDNYVLKDGARDSGLVAQKEKTSDTTTDEGQRTRNQGQVTNDIIENSIAVLPFADMSPDKNLEYFADGIAEELLNQLAKIRGLQVAGRTSSFYFKGKTEDFKIIGEKLGVAHILEGSVRKAGDRVRITTQLIKAADGYHLWSETYDRTMEDIFTIQDEIARSVANALQITLGVGDLGRTPGMTRNVEAYENFLAGRSLFYRLNRENVARAIERLEQAVALDTEFAVAWGTLIIVYTAAGQAIFPQKAVEYLAKRDAARARVIALVPEADYVLGLKAQQSGDWVEVERLRKQALTQNPSQYETNFQYGQFLSTVGRPTEAIEYSQRAVRLEPLDTIPHIFLGLTYEYTGNPAAAAEEFKTVGELSNNPALSNTSLLVLALEANDRALIDEYVAPDAPMRKYLDNPEGVEAHLRQLLTEPASTTNPYNRQAVAVWAAYFGKYDLALEIWQEIAGRDFILVFWRPIMKPMRRLPGFKDLVTKIGLVDYWRTTGNWGEFCHPVGENDFECN